MPIIKRNEATVAARCAAMCFVRDCVENRVRKKSDLSDKYAPSDTRPDAEATAMLPDGTAMRFSILASHGPTAPSPPSPPGVSGRPTAQKRISDRSRNPSH